MSESVERPLRAVDGDRGNGATAEDAFAETGRRIADDLERIDAMTRRFARERPLLAAGLALTAGFVIGRLVARHG